MTVEKQQEQEAELDIEQNPLSEIDKDEMDVGVSSDALAAESKQSMERQECINAVHRYKLSRRPLDIYEKSASQMIHKKFQEMKQEVEQINSAAVDNGLKQEQAPAKKSKEEIKKMMNFFKRQPDQRFPLTSVHRIMKNDEDVGMVSFDARMIMAKACEMFITDLTIQAYTHTEKDNRKNLKRKDILKAVSQSHIFDFLIDTFPKNELYPNDPLPLRDGNDL